MNRTLNYGWRLIATAIAFVIFGFGGLILRLIIIPLMSLLLRKPPSRVLYVRLVVHYSFRLFVRLLQALGILTFQIIGEEKLKRSGMLILANHPTLIDVVFLISLVPNANCVVKKELAFNPFTRGPVTAAGYICNDSGSGIISDCIQSVNMGGNLIIFPEGTRTPVDGKITLQRGAANIAVRGAINVTPVEISCTESFLFKGAPWWSIPSRPAHMVIEVKDDINVAPFMENTNFESTLAVRNLTEYLCAYFTKGKEVNARA